MTIERAYSMMMELREVFDIVRLVNVTESLQYTINDEGKLVRQPERCFAVWNKTGRCENCVSSRAFTQKTQMTKFEFLGDDIYYVTSKYVEVDDKPYMLEMVSRLHDNVFFGAYDKREFIGRIESYGSRLYTDALTGVRNRTYFEEQVATMKTISAVAMMDVDHFKGVNDTFGHPAGDAALRKVADCICRCVRKTDIVVRYGGDEFVLVFTDISYEVFMKRLEKIRETVEQARVEGYDEMRLSISIGGYYADRMCPDTLKKADELLYEAKKTHNAVKTECQE